MVCAIAVPVFPSRKNISFNTGSLAKTFSPLPSARVASSLFVVSIATCFSRFREFCFSRIAEKLALSSPVYVRRKPSMPSRASAAATAAAAASSAASAAIVTAPRDGVFGTDCASPSMFCHSSTASFCVSHPESVPAVGAVCTALSSSPNRNENEGDPRALPPFSRASLR